MHLTHNQLAGHRPCATVQSPLIVPCIILSGRVTYTSRDYRLQETLLDCIRSTVRTHCNAEATRLVHLLVRPSLKLSERCSDDSSTVATGRTEKQPVSDVGMYPRYDYVTREYIKHTCMQAMYHHCHVPTRSINSCNRSDP